MGKYLELVKGYIEKGCTDNGSSRDVKHYKRTLYWLLQLRSDSDEALQIAAYSHDAERVFRTVQYDHSYAGGRRDLSRVQLCFHSAGALAVL